MRILEIVFLLSVCGCPQARRLPISDVLEIEKLSKNVTYDLFKMYKLLPKDVGLSAKAKGQSILFKEFKLSKNKIDKFNVQTAMGSRILDAIVLYTDTQSELKLKLKEVNGNIDFIYAKYEDMATFIENKTASALLHLKLEDLASVFVSHYNNSIQGVLNSIHDTIAPLEGGVPTVFKIIMDTMRVQGNSMFCKINSSEQQLYLHLYNTLALTELKGFLMMEFSYMLLKLNNQGNFTKEIEAAQELYKYRSGTTLKLTIEAVQSAPVEFWKCDPDKQVKNETYIEITQLIQGFIENERNVRHKKDCLKTCAKKNESRARDCKDPLDKICKMNRPCNGKIFGCHTIFDGARVCFADAGSDRRYEYMVERGLYFGKKTEKRCFEILLDTLHTSLIVVCDFCMCYCDQQGVNSDRFLSLRLSESDIHLNKVVTGLRFVKKNRIIHLQIQQGKLLPGAKIDVNNVDWKPVEAFRLHDRVNGRDYHTFTSDTPGIYLDDLVAEDNQLLTGVGFRRVGWFLLLQVRLTPFNFTTGTLETGKSNWNYDDGPYFITRLNMDNKDIPILDQKRSHLFSKPKTVVRFTHSDLRMDLAQTTVPFIDAQAVTLAQPVALSGAGLMHKGSTKYGGFITPKIITYDYSNALRNAYDDNNYIYL